MKELAHRFWKKKQVEYRLEGGEHDERIVSMCDAEDRWEWDEFVFANFTPMPDIVPVAAGRRYGED